MREKKLEGCPRRTKYKTAYHLRLYCHNHHTVQSAWEWNVDFRSRHEGCTVTPTVVMKEER